MGYVDGFFLAVLGVSLVLGAWRGLVYELISLSGWVASFMAAQWWALAAADRLPLAGADGSIRYAAGFLVVFIGALFASAVVAVLAKKIVAALGLKPADRALGAFFGLVRGAVLLLAAAVVILVTPLHSDAWWRESKGAPLLAAVLDGLKPALPEQFGRYLP
jgi:membrane protein required for colicin V production